MINLTVESRIWRQIQMLLHHMMSYEFMMMKEIIYQG
ncbi:unnamed protein product [Brugia pahangi]|uniref:Uncharacterized protein n=1 Tax=Brugia pahangi TaxID=6280 RepID=A0A0N4TDU7_BRUPA|nr:unnamed protein product [Brugia pahangi]